MTEVLFYHLERQPLEQVLPVLLQKTLERGWRAVVQAGGEERVEALSSAIWSWREEAFIPHGTSRDGHGEHQPVWITDGDDAPNRPQVRFLVDGADATAFDGLERAVFVFDGRDPEAVEQARTRWKALKSGDHDIAYWQQDDTGRWQKRA